MQKQTHKRKALGDVAHVLENASSISAAARQLGVDRSTVHRWIQAGHVTRPTRDTDAGTAATEAPRPSAALTLDDVLGDARPGRDWPARDALWLALRSEMFASLAGGPFDPRCVLTLAGADLETWKRKRRAHLARRYRDDPRVRCEGAS